MPKTVDLAERSDEYIVINAGLSVLDDMDDPTTPAARDLLRFLVFFLDQAKERAGRARLAEVRG